jgi:hypothetical protein
VGAELSPCLSLFQVMERLPREILQKIFVEIYFCDGLPSMLSAALVCKQWLSAFESVPPWSVVLKRRYGHLAIHPSEYPPSKLPLDHPRRMFRHAALIEKHFRLQIDEKVSSLSTGVRSREVRWAAYEHAGMLSRAETAALKELQSSGSGKAPLDLILRFCHLIDTIHARPMTEIVLLLLHDLLASPPHRLFLLNQPNEAHRLLASLVKYLLFALSLSLSLPLS